MGLLPPAEFQICFTKDEHKRVLEELKTVVPLQSMSRTNGFQSRCVISVSQEGTHKTGIQLKDVHATHDRPRSYLHHTR